MVQNVLVVTRQIGATTTALTGLDNTALELNVRLETHILGNCILLTAAAARDFVHELKPIEEADKSFRPEKVHARSPATFLCIMSAAPTRVVFDSQHKNTSCPSMLVWHHSVEQQFFKSTQTNKLISAGTADSYTTKSYNENVQESLPYLHCLTQPSTPPNHPTST
jgi:hypothetical protein